MARVLIACFSFLLLPTDLFSVFFIRSSLLKPADGKRKSDRGENKNSYRMFSSRTLLTMFFFLYFPVCFSCVSTCKGRGRRMLPSTAVSMKLSTSRRQKHVDETSSDKRLVALYKGPQEVFETSSPDYDLAKPN